MKLLIFHISDLHHSSQHPIPNCRFALASNPVAALLHGKPDHIIIAIGGDLIDRGDLSLLSDIDQRLSALIASIAATFKNIPISKTIVPGNHDCDFTIDNSVRSHLLESVEGNSETEFCGKFADEILEPQKEFFEFANDNVIEKASVQSFENIDPRIAWFHTISATENVRLTCFNTAFLSKKYESPGELRLPFNISYPSEGFNLALMHHPINWLEAWNSKDLRRAFLKSHSIVMTGHEHRPDVVETTAKNQGGFLSIEAPIFFSNDASNYQGFTCVFVDTQSYEHQEIQFLWKDDVYLPFQNGKEIHHSQPLLPLDMLRESTILNPKWKFCTEFLEYLSRTDLGIIHHAKEDVKLDDIFVWPDVRELVAESNYKTSKIIAGKKLSEEISKRQITFILGPENSGKTALAKSLIRKYREDGKLPVFSEGMKVPSDPRQFRAFVNSLCESHYGSSQVDHFLNKPLEQKVLIIDNYHDVPKQARRDYRLLEMLNAQCGQIIILCSDTELSPLDLAEFAINQNFKISVMNVLPFSVGSQTQLIRRWLSLDQDLSDDSAKYKAKEVECLRLITAIVGHGHIQSSPPYLLAILQSAEAGQTVDVSASTHGHMYEAFILAALSKRTSVTNHNILRSFVSHLAYAAFVRNIQQFDTDFIEEVYTQWELATDLKRDINQLIDDLVKIRFLRNTSGEISFSEKYIYYYFTAAYLKDTIEHPETMKIIRDCVSRVWVEDYANVLLFFAHLSKNTFVIEQLIRAASKEFINEKPADLIGDFGMSLNANSRVAIEANAPIKEETTTEEEREAELVDVARESNLQELPKRFDRTSERKDLDMVGELCSGLKTLQILGQFIKNFPANFTPQQKVEIVDCCINLGLRTLGRYLSFTRENQEDIIKEFCAVITGKKTDILPSEADDAAKVALVNLCLISAFGVIKRISYAIGSEELELTYKKVFDLQKDPPSRNLIELSLKLDKDGSFPRKLIEDVVQEWGTKNYLASSVLRGLVTRHFRIFETSIGTRQRMRELLNLKENDSTKMLTYEKIVPKSKSRRRKFNNSKKRIHRKRKS